MGSMAEKVEKVEKKSVFVGGNGQASTGTHASELEHAKDIARRYRCEFVDLHDFQLHHDLFTKIPRMRIQSDRHWGFHLLWITFVLSCTSKTSNRQRALDSHIAQSRIGVTSLCRDVSTSEPSSCTGVTA